MPAIRRLLAQRHLAVLLCVAVLLLKLLVPTGYMIANDRAAITIVTCSGMTTEAMAMPGMGDDMATTKAAMPDHQPSTDHGKTEMPCAYAGLSAQILGAVDPVILLAALAVVATSALLAAPGATLQPHPYLRPPLRGPPLSLK
ncbi:hypothetical protein IFR23_17085 [Sphingomonas sp. CFBP 13603]|uniref:DUF2946 family protein n=1 Tax=Sphingomonas sp. CFBP 13603 TaxID=2774040 RepID=UPI001865BCB3|nr:DUF2946 family protein [Sphingomonas sp. CFBP 13603]MBE2993718.1 hypothetical protein [Sphingomonas sp. CFBP 13603]